MVRIAAISLLMATTTAAQTAQDEYGTLNPPDTGFGRVKRVDDRRVTGFGRVMSNIDNGVTDLVTCAIGYFITKSGRHEAARTLFKSCAEAGYTGAMT